MHMSEDYIDRTQQAYAASPDKYIESTGEMTPTDELRQFVDLLPDRDSPVLDLGSASGRDTEVMASMGLKSEGVDLSDALIERAKKLHTSIRFSKMDARELQFPDNHFAGVWSNAVLHHLNDNDLTTALTEVIRVLKPGGIFCMSHKEGEGSRWVDEKFSSDLSRFYNFKQADELEALLRKVGFSIVASHTRNEQEMFGPNYRDLRWVWVFATKPI
jgi:ubiquinone/menaquinone biosynthesis C-methylase UbiE